MRPREECCKGNFLGSRTMLPASTVVRGGVYWDASAWGEREQNGMFLLEDGFLEWRHSDGRKLMLLCISMIAK